MLGLRRQDCERGFSLVELLLAMTIFSFGLLIITYGIISLIKIYSNGVADRSTQNAARVAINRIVQVGRQASSFAYNTAGGAICVSGPSPTVFFISSNTLYQNTWPGTTNATCVANPTGAIALTPTSVQAHALTAEQTDNYVSGSAAACDTDATHASLCKSLRVNLRVVSNTASVDASGNCLPAVSVCSSTNLSTSLTAGSL